MNFMARGSVHVELIDPATGVPIPWKEGAEGELVYTALQRDAMPLLRFRSRDHVVVNMEPNPTGRTGPRIRCVGRTDDMLIVRGVNLFPSAIRSILKEFLPDVSGLLQVRPREHGVVQLPPLPVAVELGEGFSGNADDVAARIETEIRSRLLVTTAVRMVPHGSLPRETYKTKLIDYSDVEAAEAASA
jgi:phenylacetate-CoA ligase